MALFPEIEPFATHMLPVSDLHTIYVEQCGNPQGKPVIFLHGGPGGGVEPVYRRYFDPKTWHIILFDQRGCGRSQPFSELQANTTWDLVGDMEKIREFLHIDRWVVFGGSWGSTLSLAYAESHPERTKGLVLRGIFLGRKREMDWLYQRGASHLYPDAWEDFLAPIPELERDDMIKAYYARLTSSDGRVRSDAAKAWSIWEARTSKLVPDESLIARFGGDQFADAFARIECHYFINRCFLEHDQQLLTNAVRLQDIPGVIVHGRYDIVCTLDNAWELHKKWPRSQLYIAPTSGHSMTEKETTELLLRHTAELANL